MAREAHEFHVLVGNPAEQAMDIFRLQRHGKRHFAILVYSGALRCLNIFRECKIFPLSKDTVHGLLLVLGRLAGSTTILGLLATTGNSFTRLDNRLPTGLALGFQNARIVCLVNQEIPTLETDATENFHSELEELGVIDGPSKRIMTEMAGTVVVVLTTCTAHFAILQHTHAGIKETTELPFGRGRGGDLTHRSAHNLLWTENAELNAHNGLSFGRMWQEWHVSM